MRSTIVIEQITESEFIVKEFADNILRTIVYESSRISIIQANWDH